MELVRGVPITNYCDEEQLTIRERLELFVPVCRAVQHAHQKGIIHRDIKPSNILVTMHDGMPVPKVIDFGVAKAIGQKLTDKTVYTAFTQLIGTPLYMSPEQVELSGLDIDTRSDIYSLGVLLYELLTGTTPFDPETLKRVAFEEMRRIIREEEPPRPSTRLSSLGATLSTVSTQRQADPRRLGAFLRGELDWVVMKALEKDRRRRYETAGDFAADVMRFLTEEAVEACPPSASYRLAKFARRNRAALTTAATVFAALTLGLGLATWQAVEARRANRKTVAALEASRDRLSFARRAVDDMYTQVAEKWLKDQPSLTPVQREFLEKASAFYERFASEDDSRLGLEAVQAGIRVGKIRRELGQLAKAEAALRRALERGNALVPRSPDRDRLAYEIAHARIELAKLSHARGREAEAEQGFVRGLEELAKLQAAFPADPIYRRSLAVSYHDRVVMLYSYGRVAEADEAERRAIPLWESLVRDFPADHGHRFGLAVAVQNEGYAEARAGRSEEALATFRKCLAMNEGLVADHSEVVLYRRGLASALSGLGAHLRRLGRNEEAEAVHRRALASLESLTADFPGFVSERSRLGNTLVDLGTIVGELGRMAEAIELCRRAVTVMEGLAKAHPELPDGQAQAAGSLHNLATKLVNRGEHAEARTVLERAIRYHRNALILDPRRRNGMSIDMRRGGSAFFLAVDLRMLAECLIELGDYDAAARAINECARSDANDSWNLYLLADLISTTPVARIRNPELALRLARKAVELSPGDATALQSLGWALYRTGDWKECIEAIEKSMGISQKGDGAQWFFLAMAHWQIGEKAQARARFEQADRWLAGYERREAERIRSRGQGTHPGPQVMRRVRAEAAELLELDSSPEAKAAVSDK